MYIHFQDCGIHVAYKLFCQVHSILVGKKLIRVHGFRSQTTPTVSYMLSNYTTHFLTIDYCYQIS